MNPRVWELWIEDGPRLGDNLVAKHIERNRDRGFTIKVVSRVQLEAMESRMINWFRFRNGGLDSFGVENLYVPRPEFWERAKREYGPREGHEMQRKVTYG